MRGHQCDCRNHQQGDQTHEHMQIVGTTGNMTRDDHDDTGHHRVDAEIDKTDEAAGHEEMKHLVHRAP
jgi:hypothetical protein